MQTTNGDFAFRVQKNVAYPLRAVEKNYVQQNALTPNYYLGDQAVLQWVKKN